MKTTAAAVTLDETGFLTTTFDLINFQGALHATLEADNRVSNFQLELIGDELRLEITGTVDAFHAANAVYNNQRNANS
jgi:hypothetical protein